MKALVTGASAGLGAAIADGLVLRGAQVLNLDRMSSTLHATLLCDLSDRVALDAALPEIVRRGPHHWLVLNAGASATGPFEALPVEAMMRLVRLNAEAPMVIATRMLAEGAVGQGGHIVLVSSLSHFTGYPGAAAYAATKDALAIFARSIRPAAKARGVSVTVAFPGPLRTDHAARHAPAGADASRRMDPSVAARLILDDAEKGRARSVPGAANRLAALAGTLVPTLMTALMRRLIYEKLDRTQT